MALAVSTAVQVNGAQLGQESTQEPTSTAQTKSTHPLMDGLMDGLSPSKRRLVPSQWALRAKSRKMSESRSLRSPIDTASFDATPHEVEGSQ